MGGIVESWKTVVALGIANGAAVSSTGGMFNTPGDAPNDGIIDISRYSWASLQVPATWTTADITFKACATRSGTYLPCYDKDATLLRAKVGSNTSSSFSFPGEVFQHGPFLKINSTNTASAADVNQGGARTVTIVLGT